jgi:hypothetical protein
VSTSTIDARLITGNRIIPRCGGGLRNEEAKIGESVTHLGDHDPVAALAVFDWSQNVAEIWDGSKIAAKREILRTISLNRTLGNASSVTTKRKPFESLVEGLSVQSGRGDWI